MMIMSIYLYKSHTDVKFKICLHTDVWERFYADIAGEAYLLPQSEGGSGGYPCDGQIEVGLTSGGFAWTIGCALSFVLWFGYLYVWSGLPTCCLLPTIMYRRERLLSARHRRRDRAPVKRTDGFIKLMEQDELIHELGETYRTPPLYVRDGDAHLLCDAGDVEESGVAVDKVEDGDDRPVAYHCRDKAKSKSLGMIIPSPFTSSSSPRSVGNSVAKRSASLDDMSVAVVVAAADCKRKGEDLC
jgi:hypothetical protein